MNNLPSKETVARLRARFPQGCRVGLVRMNDPYTNLQPGDRGRVDFIDDAGTAHCAWDNGSTRGAMKTARLTCMPWRKARATAAAPAECATTASKV